MKIITPVRIAALFFAFILLNACTVDKLEARLQADPECKPVVNSKTGALMPCPGTDKQFYKSIPALNTSAPTATQTAVAQQSSVDPTPSQKTVIAPVECRPQLHKSQEV